MRAFASTSPFIVVTLWFAALVCAASTRTLSISCCRSARGGLWCVSSPGVTAHLRKAYLGCLEAEGQWTLFRSKCEADPQLLGGCHPGDDGS
jgi:hypothetical protein